MTFSPAVSQMAPVGSGIAVPPRATRAPGQSDHRVRRQLPNGLTVIAESMPVDAVNLSVWVKVGSVLEPTPINGMTHFLEHMVFKGTERLKLGEFEKITESCGAVTNAATSQDYTQFYLTCAPADFRKLAPLQIDVVMNAALPAAEFERERRVVLEEIRRSEDNPRRRFFRQMSTVGLERSPYSRPILGPSEVVGSLPVEAMRRFHRQYYRPDNVTAIAVGNLPPKALIDAVVEGFEQAWGQSSTLAEPAFCPPAPRSLPAFDTIVRQECEDPTLQQARLALVWRVPGLTGDHSTYSLDVLSTILARGRTARLVQELRENLGLVTSISASNLTYARQGLFYISAQLPTAHLEEVENRIRQQLVRLMEEPVTPAELARIKTRVANSFIFSNEPPSNRAGLYGYYETLTGDMQRGIQYPDAIRRLTLEELQDAACRWLNPEAYGCAIMRPTEVA